MERGKFVSRSVYQKVCEENKKLLSDIKILTDAKMSIHPEKILLVAKWREKFEKNNALNKLLSDYAKAYFEEHPEEKITV